MKKFINMVLDRQDNKKTLELIDSYMEISKLPYEETQSALESYVPKLNALYQKYTKRFKLALDKNINDAPPLFYNLQATSLLAALALNYQGNYEAALKVLDYYESLIRDERLTISAVVFDRITLQKAENQLAQWVVSFDSKEPLFTQDQIYDIRDVFFQQMGKDKLTCEDLALYYFTEGLEDRAKNYLKELFNKPEVERESLAQVMWEGNKMLAFQCSIGRDYQDFLKAFFAENNIDLPSYSNNPKKSINAVPTARAPSFGRS